MISQSNKILFSLLLAFSTLIEPVFSQNLFEFKGNRKELAIPFKKSRSLIIVPMYINNKGPFNFILDTGVGMVIITDPALKDSLNLKFLRKMEVIGLGENENIAAFSAPFLSLRVGNVATKSSAVAILADDVFHLSAYTGMPIHGLLGFDFFNSFLVRINYEASILKIYKNKTMRLSKKGFKIPFNLESNKPYVDILVDTQNGKHLNLKVLIDIGSGHSLSLESYQNKAFPIPTKHISANLGIGLNGKINGYKGRVDTLKLGKFVLNNVLTSFPDYENISQKNLSVSRNGSIGNPLIKKFDVLFDYQQQCMYLKPNSNFKEPFEQDMSGIEFSAVGENFNRFIVTRVEKNSPADELGILENDEIIRINFVNTSKMTMDEITKILSIRNGESVCIEIARNEETIIGILNLKRRI